MQFYPLLISEIQKTTEDCTVVTFDLQNGLKEEFKFTQGQYLNLRSTINGEEIRRSYSLCTSPDEGLWKIAVKKIEGGVFSTFVNDELKVGDRLEVAPPAGQFNIDLAPEISRNIVVFAAGSGITPILSIIKTHLRNEPDVRVQLFYVNQNVSSIILKEELEHLKNTFLDRFEIHYMFTQQERDISILNGRIDEEKLEQLCKVFIDVDSIDEIFTCGPKEMMLCIRAFFQSKNIDNKHIHLELFGDNQHKITRKVSKKFEGKTADITLNEGGKKMKMTVPQGSITILDAALQHASDLPFACKGGVCCTCKAKLLEGKVNMEVNYALEDDQVKEGYILTCQAIPVSEKIVVDFDQ